MVDKIQNMHQLCFESFYPTLVTVPNATVMAHLNRVQQVTS